MSPWFQPSVSTGTTSVFSLDLEEVRGTREGTMESGEAVEEER